ncbi:MAG: hypothetical protein L6420_12090 [Elusimicrobia bacterium]|nr:hypothetical protein [Elusimicrobiota bacterium]
MKPLKSLFPLILLLLISCASNRQKDAIILSSEPSIERAMDILSETPEGKELVDFLYANPIRIEYSNTAGLCHKFAFKKNRIYIAKDFKKSEILLALEVARAAFIYKMRLISKLEEIISEEEEAAALLQSRIALQLNFVNDDFIRFPFSSKIKSEFCTYIMDGQEPAIRKARYAALITDPDCQLPLETLHTQKIWLGKIKESAGKGNFFQVLLERDLEKVKKGVLSMSEAMQNDSRNRGLNTYDIYRYQRAFYDDSSKTISNFEKIYRQEIKKDANWRERNADILERAGLEFSQCNLLYE